MLSTFDPERLPASIASSIVAFIGLVARGKLHLRRERLEQRYAIESRGSYVVFRETAAADQAGTVPVVLVVGFRLGAIRSMALPHWLFQRLCILTTPFWSGFPGFRVKLWMVEPETKDYLGIYDWDGEEDARTYAEALARVLRAVSVSGSVWYELHGRQELEPFLRARES
jgi:hypothetical protein